MRYVGIVLSLGLQLTSLAKLEAQESPALDQHMADVASTLSASGRVAYQSEGLVIRYSQSLVSYEGCEASFGSRQDTNLDAGDLNVRYLVNFALASPEIVLDSAGIPGLVVLTLLSSTGDTDFSVSKLGTGLEVSRGQDVHRMEFVVRTWGEAQTLRRTLAAAILACGGVPRSAAAEARAEELDRARMTPSQRRMAEFSSEEQAAAKQACQDLVRKQLRASSSARFLADPSLWINESGKAILLGQVEGQNGYGAWLRRSYTCTGEPFGKQIVVEEAVILE